MTRPRYRCLLKRRPPMVIVMVMVMVNSPTQRMDHKIYVWKYMRHTLTRGQALFYIFRGQTLFYIQHHWLALEVATPMAATAAPNLSWKPTVSHNIDANFCCTRARSKLYMHTCHRTQPALPVTYDSNQSQAIQICRYTSTWTCWARCYEHYVLMLTSTSVAQLLAQSQTVWHCTTSPMVAFNGTKTQYHHAHILILSWHRCL